MSGSIAFNYIPSNLKVPLFYAEFSTTGGGFSQPVQRALLIGQATATVPSTPVPTRIDSTAWADSTYGAGSQIAIMARAYRANDPSGEIWALPLPDNGSGTAATGTVVFTGPASANGTVFLGIGGLKSNYLLTVGVTNGQTASQVATAVAAAVNAAYGLPVTASANSGTVTFTARNAGTLGNDIPITINPLGSAGGQALPAGLTAAITAMSGGATDPSIASIATWLGNTAFDAIVNPFCTATPLGYTSAAMSDATGRWSYASQLWGHVFSAARASTSSLATLGASLNDQHLTVLGVNSASPTAAWIWLAAMVGALFPSLKNQPNRPLHTIAIQGVLPEPLGSDIGLANRQTLLSTGIALAQRAPDGGAQLVRAVTTYQLNAYGQPDASYLDTETLFTLMAVIRRLSGAITQKYPRALLADDGTRFAASPPGTTPVLVTPGIIRGELIAQYGQMVDASLVQGEASFAAGLSVQRNANDASRVDVLFDPNLVSGLRIFAVMTQFYLSRQAAAAA